MSTADTTLTRRRCLGCLPHRATMSREVALLTTILADETETMAALRLIHVFRHIAQQPLLKDFNTAMRSLHSCAFWRQHVH